MEKKRPAGWARKSWGSRCWSWTGTLCSPGS